MSDYDNIIAFDAGYDQGHKLGWGSACQKIYTRLLTKRLMATEDERKVIDMAMKIIVDVKNEGSMLMEDDK